MRDSALLLASFCLVCFPLLTVLSDLAGLLWPEAFFAQPVAFGWLRFLDGGGQQEPARSLFRIGLILASTAALPLPFPSWPRGGRSESVPWAGLFLLAGLLSVAASPRPYPAETEWETWVLLIAFTLLLRRVAPAGLGRVLLFGLYVVCLGFFLHALWIAVPAGSPRLGGAFNHPNALSSFTLFTLPLLCWRALEGRKDSRFAAFLLGPVLATQIWTGSLTGAALLLGAMTYWALGGRNRWLGAAFVVLLTLAFNLLGGWAAALGFPTLFLGLLGRLLWLYGERHRVNLALFLLSLLLACGAFTALAPAGTSGAVQARERSGSARLEFYRAALEMVVDQPLLGQGPNGFSRAYPAYQSTILDFSRYVHCLPLEVATEWGLPAALFGGLALFAAWRSVTGRETAKRAFGWAAALFLLHTLTGVQSQFPYLLLLPLLGYAATAPAGEKATTPRWLDRSGRLLLSAALLLLLALNVSRLAASLQVGLALEIYRTAGARGAEASESLLRAALRNLPLDGETALLLGRLHHRSGEDRLAAVLAREAVGSDPRWAAPRHLEMLSQPAARRPERIEEALTIDPLNYPAFHQYRAEALVEQGQAGEALLLLYRESARYTPTLLDRLPDFRADELEDQLVEFWLLIATLEEWKGRVDLAERAFRISLHHSRRRVHRLRDMIAYPDTAGVSPGPVVSSLLRQLAHQVPPESAFEERSAPPR